MPTLSNLRSRADNATTVKELAAVVVDLCKLIDELQEELQKVKRLARNAS